MSVARLAGLVYCYHAPERSSSVKALEVSGGEGCGGGIGGGLVGERELVVIVRRTAGAATRETCAQVCMCIGTCA